MKQAKSGYSALAQAQTSILTERRYLTSPAVPRFAEWNPYIGAAAPVCLEMGSSCDTGETLIAGVGSYEQNSPNTVDGCMHYSEAAYQQEESIDRIIVSSKDGGIMTAGSPLQIRATVSTAVDTSARSNPDQLEMAHMYYHSESTGTWEHICTRSSWGSPPGVGSITFVCDFEIPEDNYFGPNCRNCGLQAVRVNYGYGEYIIEACTETGLWDVQYSDADDLIFLVASAPASTPSMAPTLSSSTAPTEEMTEAPTLIPTFNMHNISDRPTLLPSWPPSIPTTSGDSSSTDVPTFMPSWTVATYYPTFESSNGAERVWLGSWVGFMAIIQLFV